MEIDNRDMNETWLHVDGKVIKVSRQEARNILLSFYENSEGGDDLLTALQELYDWTIGIILDSGGDVVNGKVVERIDS